MSEVLDMVIVGAGISGIGMAARLAMECPGKRYAIIDRRERAGGTWDLFRYPGIRSDSDMHTFAYDFEPWTATETIATAEQIRDYLGRVIDKHGIAPNMRFGLLVESAAWDSATGRWAVQARAADGTAASFLCRFLFMGSGYYDYDTPHDAGIPGLDRFRGKVIHPQFWPEDYDYAGKQIVIIGSGATAVTLVPAMAKTASHVTMLQRTPTWYGIRPGRNGFAAFLRRVLPARLAWAINREMAQRLHELIFRKARGNPEGFGAFLKGKVKEELGESYQEADFTPPYNPWEQRLCLVPDGDMFAAMRDGRASVVTGTIRTVTVDGIELDDGRKLEADVIVTATGLRLATLGNVRLTLDGAPVDARQHIWYRNCMFSSVPNLFVAFGYLNAGWTLRVGLITKWICRLLRHMARRQADVVTPVLPENHGFARTQPVDLLSSGYLQRGKHIIPQSTDAAPWRLQMSYREDKAEFAKARIDDGWLQFRQLERGGRPA